MQETMSNEHAMRFPLVGSAMLLSLFLLFKFLPKDLVNAVLTCYFFVLGIVALSYVLAHYLLQVLVYCVLFASLAYFFFFLIFNFSGRQCYLQSAVSCQSIGMRT